MQYLLNLVSRFGTARAAIKTGYARLTVSAIARGIRRPTGLQLKKFRSVFRRSQYKRLRTAGFTPRIARAFRDLSMPHVSSRVSLMNKSVENLLQRRLAEKRIMPKDVERWLRETRFSIRQNMAMSDKDWKDLQYPTVEY